MSHIDRKIREREAVRSNILMAARKIALQQGWNAVTIRKIADEIEYTPPIVYEHFLNKEDLIKEIVESGFLQHKQNVMRIIDENNAPKTTLMNLSLSQWEFAEKNPELYQLMFSLERPTPSEEHLAAISKMQKVFSDITGCDKETAAEIMFNWVCLSNGIISMALRFGLPPDINKSALEFFQNSIQRFINAL